MIKLWNGKKYTLRTILVAITTLISGIALLVHLTCVIFYGTVLVSQNLYVPLLLFLLGLFILNGKTKEMKKLK